MSATTIEEQLAEVRRRIERLQRRRRSAAASAAPSTYSDDVEQRLAQLKTRLDVAEHSLTADVSDDWATFAAAVEEELESWDTYLERLQTTVAARAWKARERAEAAIGDVRSRRIAVDERLAQVRDVVGDDWRERREARLRARDELEQKADELSTKLN